jgi:hypothetical protein|tara:strand:+ start:1870 stop:2973 length:1104 start_codon:yes stop_codon:yes gene_type:complete
MKLKKNIAVNFFTVIIILSSCSNVSINTQNDIIKQQDKNINQNNINKFSMYQYFSPSDLEELNKFIMKSDASEFQLKAVQKISSNLNKIKSKKNYALSIHPNNKYSEYLMEIIYNLDLPITISWDETSREERFFNLLAGKTPDFCSSLYEDALQSIFREIHGSQNSTLIIYSPEYNFMQSIFSKRYPLMESVELNSSNPQAFSAQILEIKSSTNRFKKISSLNSNQKLKFFPRPRADIKTIILLLESKKYKSLLPALRYHGGDKYRYINFISSIEKIDNSMELLDYENSEAPFSSYLSDKIKNNKLLSLEGILEKSVITDWLTIQLLKQSGIQSAEINGMTGQLKFKRNSCVKRIIPMQRINSKWIT